jgi:hypothetical protein
MAKVSLYKKFNRGGQIAGKGWHNYQLLCPNRTEMPRENWNAPDSKYPTAFAQRGTRSRVQGLIGISELMANRIPTIH